MAKVTVTGASGFLGSWVVPRLKAAGHTVTTIRGRAMDDLRDPDQAFEAFLYLGQQDVVVHLAYPGTQGIGSMVEKPGTIAAETLQIDLNVITACVRLKVPRLICMGSVCAYPQNAPERATEDDLWSGSPEEINAPYGHARRMQAALLEGYRRESGLEGLQLVLGNLYGPGDRSGHVIPALTRRMLDAGRSGGAVTVWGSGHATREFLYVDDAARAIVEAVDTEDTTEIPPILNIVGGPLNVVEIATLAYRIALHVGLPEDRVCFDSTKPEGQQRRSFSGVCALHALGWRPEMPFAEGLTRTVNWIKEQYGKA